MTTSQSLRSLRHAALAAALTCCAVGAQAADYTQLIAFGDSLSDNGNLLAATSAVVGVANAVPQTTDYYQGRFSNGKAAVEYLAQNLGVSLTDFAFGGALTGATNGAVAASPLSMVPQLLNTGLLSQVGMFQASLGGAAADSSALYFVWAGANDFFYQGASLATAATAIDNLVNAVGSLYSLGARNFLLPTLPGLGSTPESLALSAALGDPTIPFQLNALTQSFNDGLTLAYSNLAALLPGATLTMFDSYGAQQAVLANPAAFGLSNTTDACFTGYVGVAGTQCADASGYMFWDKVHPTTTTNAILGAGMAAAVPEPSTLLTMALGTLALLGARQRRR